MAKLRFKYKDKNIELDNLSAATSWYQDIGDRTPQTLTFGDQYTLQCGGKLLSGDIIIGSHKLKTVNKLLTDSLSIILDALIPLNKPTARTIEYSGTVVYIKDWLNNYIPEYMMIKSGTDHATNVGSYSCVIGINDPSSYNWTDGSNSDITINWNISKVSLAIPSQKNIPTYDGNTKTPEWNNYDSSKINISVTPTANAGAYSATFTVKDTTNYQFTNGNTTANVSWVINRATTAIPLQTNVPTYDGNAKTPEWNNYDSSKMSVSVTPQTNAGSYSATFTINSNYLFADGSTTKNVSWAINKASAQLSVSPSTQTWDANGGKTFTLSNAKGRTLSVSGTNSYFACTAPATSESDISFTITASGQSSSKHTATITISAAANTNYTESSCTVGCTLSASSCVSGDTLITLADGSKKRMDEITYADTLLTYDLDTGMFAPAAISKIYNHGPANEILVLTFDYNTIVKVVNKHGFLNCTKREWSQIDADNCADYIGDEFLMANGVRAHLVSAHKERTYASSWSILTAYNENFITDDMVSLTGDRYSLFAIDEDMTYDATAKENDIATYGTFDYAEFADKMSEKDFYELNCQYYKIPLEKGIIDMEYINTYIPVLVDYNVVPKE